MYIDDDKNKLILHTELKKRKTEKKEKVINVDGKREKTIWADIVTAYLDDYYHLIIKGKELKKHRILVKKTIYELVALELVDESSERIIAKSFLNFEDAELKLLIRRVDNILRSMFIDCKESAHNAELFLTVKDTDREVNRLSLLILKLLKVAYLDKSVLASLEISESEIIKYWDLNLHLEKIGDRIKNVAELIHKLKSKKKKDFLKFFSKVEKMYLDIMKSFYTSSFALTDEVYNKRISVVGELKEYIQKNKDPIYSQIAINAFNLTTHITDIGRVVRFMS